MPERRSEDLLGQALGGDGAALAELLDRHLPGLHGFIRLRMGKAIRARESTVDLVQSVCREVILHADRMKHGGERGFKRWLYATALRKIANRAEYYKAAKRDANREAQARLSEDGTERLIACYRETIGSPSQQAMAQEQLTILEDAFEELPEHYKEVILGARFLELSYTELAEQMGRSEGSVRMLLLRALAHLSELFQKRGA